MAMHKLNNNKNSSCNSRLVLLSLVAAFQQNLHHFCNQLRSINQPDDQLSSTSPLNHCWVYSPYRYITKYTPGRYTTAFSVVQRFPATAAFFHFLFFAFRGGKSVKWTQVSTLCAILWLLIDLYCYSYNRVTTKVSFNGSYKLLGQN